MWNYLKVLMLKDSTGNGNISRNNLLRCYLVFTIQIDFIHTSNLIGFLSRFQAYIGSSLEFEKVHPVLVVK